MSEEGDSAAPAPVPLRWVEELVNTRSIELGTDELATTHALGVWLSQRDLLPAGTAVTPAAHRRTLRVREGLRALIAANNEPASGGSGEDLDGIDGIDGSALAELSRLARDLPLVVELGAGAPRLVARAAPSVDAALATLLAAVATAVADGTWTRLKACREPGCQWAYFDHSRNRSRAWCSMSLCGNRAKARAFRRRLDVRRSTGPGG